jgi:hypothetical protein
MIVFREHDRGDYHRTPRARIEYIHASARNLNDFRLVTVSAQARIPVHGTATPSLFVKRIRLVEKTVTKTGCEESTAAPTFEN